jgi:hypothetical protein
MGTEFRTNYGGGGEIRKERKKERKRERDIARKVFFCLFLFVLDLSQKSTTLSLGK